MKAPENSKRPQGRFELTREITIRSIHRLKSDSLTPDENQALYGVCYRTHGHDYRIQVTVSASIDETSGLIMDRDALDRVLRDKIIEPFDGADLNDHFKNTSCEALAIEFFGLLERALPVGSLKRIGIQETPKNFFEYP